MKKYNVLVVVPKYESTVNKKNYDYSFPTGLSYITAILKKAGHYVKGLNLNHFNGTVKEVLENELNKIKYDFVATGNNALGYNVTKNIIEISKNHPSRPFTILGGPIVTSEPMIIFEDIKPDFAVLGEGEEAVVELLEAISKNKNTEKVNSIIYWKDNKPVKNSKRKPPMDIDSLPFPDYEELGYLEWLDNLHPGMGGSYGESDHPRIYPLVASRSCPFQCTFCYHDNNIYRPRSINNIMKEITLVVNKYKINRIIMQDELFSANRERVIEFCRRMIEFKKTIPWEIKWFAQMRVNGVDKEILSLMKEAGCDIVGYGFESFSDEVLKSMKKMIASKDIEKAFYETLEVGLGIQANFIFGDIAETKETAYHTLNWWKKHSRGQVYMDFIQPYPDSEIYRQAIKKGVVKDRLELIKSLEGKGYAVWNFTDKMTDEEVSQLNKDIKEALSKYREYVVPYSIKKTGQNIFELDIRCPYCKTRYKMGNVIISNKWLYGFSTTCRSCNMHFYITSRLKKVGYKNYRKLKKLRNIQKNIYSKIKKLER